MLLALWTAASSNVMVVEVPAAEGEEAVVVEALHRRKGGMLLGLQRRVNPVHQSPLRNPLPHLLRSLRLPLDHILHHHRHPTLHQCLLSIPHRRHHHRITLTL